MKKFISLITSVLIISAILFSSFSAGAVEVNPKNRQKQFKNNSAVKFNNSAQVLDLPKSYSSKDLGYCTSVKTLSDYSSFFRVYSQESLKITPAARRLSPALRRPRARGSVRRPRAAAFSSRAS